MPRALALGFAGFLAFQQGTLQAARRREGLTVPADAAGAAIQARWRDVGGATEAMASFVRVVSADTELWGTDLAAIPGFVDIVSEHLATLREHGAVAAIESLGLSSVQ